MKGFHRQWLKSRWRKPAGATKSSPRAFERAQALASRIWQRYALRSLPRRGAGMEYLQAGSRAGLPQVLRLALNLTQRIERSAYLPLHMHVATATTAAVSPVLPGSQVPVQRYPAGRRGLEGMTLTHLQVGNRLNLGSHQRLELGSADVLPRTAAQPAVGVVEFPLIHPVPMITGPSPSVTHGVETPASAAQSEMTTHRANLSEMKPQAVEGSATGLPQVDLRRVTEQVIQEIDRRIVANRERFGRT